MAYKPPKDELLKAIDLTAVYYVSSVPDIAEGTLRLSGKFESANPVEFPRFERKPLVGGLLYEVRGLVYNPAVKEYTKPIPDHDTTIELPNPDFPSDSITVKTSIGEILVEIHFVDGYAPPLTESNASIVFEDLQAGGVQAGKSLGNNTTADLESVRLYASDLTATYYKLFETLQLNGIWWSVAAITDAEFHHVEGFVGGIGYEVNGILVAPPTPPSDLYHGKISTINIKIELPNKVVPSNTVVFFTKDGVRTVDINFVDGPIPSTL